MSVVIPGYPKKVTISYMPKCSNIVHHKQHAYDEHGKVIVVDLPDEDRQEYINSFADQCGLKNVLAQLQKSGDVLAWRSMAYDDKTEAQDVSDIPTNVNEISDAAKNSDASISKALADFNQKTGLSLTLDEFTKAVQGGNLIDLIVAAQTEPKKEEKEGNE